MAEVMTHIYSWQTVNPMNLAEQVCRPTEYFQEFKNVVTLDQDCSDEDLCKGPVIFGGSGLFFPSIAPRLEYALRHSKHPVILWGVGANTHHGTKFEWPSWTGEFSLVGLRDWPNPWAYVPCPSCLHEAFQVERQAPVHDLIIYDQIDFPVGLNLNVPRETNGHPKSEMERIIAFLASGKTILTSSYHGAYWGFLLNRKVVVWKPFSTKFYGLKPRTVFCDDESNLELALSIPQDNAGFLEECRGLNSDFAQSVAAKLGLSFFDTMGSNEA